MQRFYYYTFYAPLALRPFFRDFLLYTWMYNQNVEIDWTEEEYLLGSKFSIKIDDRTEYAGIFVYNCNQRLMNW